MDSFLHMGGYAFYVWTSYALAIVVLAMNWIVPKRALRACRQSLLRRAQPQTGVQQTADPQTSIKEAAA